VFQVSSGIVDVLKSSVLEYVGIYDASDCANISETAEKIDGDETVERYSVTIHHFMNRSNPSGL